MRRNRQPPPLSRSLKTSLNATIHSQIDTCLKQLKSCSRSLQPVLSMFSDELQILHRIYYKGNNQHRPALFWRRVTEMRKYGDRVEELSLATLVNSLRYSFFAEESQQNSKLLKGSWTHYPDPSSASYVYERITASITLVHKMQDRLTHAYHSFSLAMQTGAFIQLILTLAGIASRLNSLVSELAAILNQVQDAIRSIQLTLDPAAPTSNSGSGSCPLPDQTEFSSVQVASDVHGEDTGVSIGREEPQRAPNNTATSVQTDWFKLSARPTSSVEVVTRTVKRSETRIVSSRPKKTRKRDEIDDIFG
ncbi:DUF4477 domain-containing protein [Favolaschia claudopus]|uniref:DUF4477 domain-containing protein n=1 Tax=Favolaschia claudopus TaxID=2862362 RepID=A0AAW0ANK9_9AGAR